MKSKDFTKSNIGDVDYACSEGMFASFNPKTDRVGTWETCREIFRNFFKSNTSHLAFNQTDLVGHIKNLSAFFNAIDKTLKLKSKITIYPTRDKNTVIVKVPQFWRDNSTRRQLLTILLRCGKNYEGNLDRAIKSYDYGSDCFTAIKHFLKGNVYPSYHYLYGFVDKFQDANDYEIKEWLLDSPKKKQKKIIKQPLTKASWKKIWN